MIFKKEKLFGTQTLFGKQKKENKIEYYNMFWNYELLLVDAKHFLKTNNNIEKAEHFHNYKLFFWQKSSVFLISELILKTWTFSKYVHFYKTVAFFEYVTIF